jgi:uncharacterized protein (TIGR03083 family)
VNLFEVVPIDVVPVMSGERAELVQLLGHLSPEQWEQPTAAPGWSVKDIALHLLDDDFGILARNRDGDTSGLIDADNHEERVAGLAAKNQRWIDGANTLSARLLIDLLTWSGEQVFQYYSTIPVSDTGHVSWASDEPVPAWFDIAREFTERWVHQVQIREALEEVAEYATEHLPTVLRAFVWAFPHQYHAQAEPGTRVRIDLGSGGVWTLTCDGGETWSLSEGGNAPVDALASFPDDCGWRVLTGGEYRQDQLTLDGPADLCEPLLAIRSIIV